MTRLPEGPVLALDTSTGIGSVAIGEGGRLLAEVVLNIGGRHSSALLPAVNAVVHWAGLAPKDLGGVVVGRGPGSFTGLRIGAATAKGIVHALNLPLWTYSGLLAAAAGNAVVLENSSTRICALFDARRRDVYAACYQFSASQDGWSVETLIEPVALTLDELLDQFRGREATLFTGEAAVIHRAEIERELGLTIPPPHLTLPRASSLLWLLQIAPELGWVEDPTGWEPEYVRASGAERISATKADSRGGPV